MLNNLNDIAANSFRYVQSVAVFNVIVVLKYSYVYYKNTVYLYSVSLKCKLIESEISA